MDIKLIAVDLDGTLLNEEKEITARTRRAVQSATEHGLTVVFCTGRSLIEMDDAIAALPQVRYAVGLSGAHIWDLKENRTLAAHGFEPQLSAQIVERLLQYDGMTCIFTGGRAGIQPEWENRVFAAFSPAVAEQCARYYRPEPEYLACAAGKYGPVEKLFSIFPSQAERDRAWEAIRPFVCEQAVSTQDNLELNAPGVTKGAGLEWLGRHLGIAREQIMAIGDSGNDRTMLTYAGVPAVVANAEGEIRAMAKLILPSNEDDGVAWALERLAEGTLTWN